MDVSPFLVVGSITSILAGAVTIVGDRARRAAARGVSVVGLTVGALLGGVLITAFDLLAAYLVTSMWNSAAPAIGAPALSLLMAFAGIAVAHVWATTALARRRWQRSPVPVEIDRFDK